MKKISKKQLKEYNDRQAEITLASNEIIDRYNKKLQALTTPKNTFERMVENFEVIADMNYELVRVGGRPAYLSQEEQIKIILACVKELKELKRKKWQFWK